MTQAPVVTTMTITCVQYKLHLPFINNLTNNIAEFVYTQTATQVHRE